MPNRLAHETSPYLLQHANNPVDWWPWCDEALLIARRHERPIFLSIGYSACHWCHVMEHESFEDPVMASLMNERFICIKVDREERPDLDQIYMSAVQAMTGSGGWPMSVFLTPDQKPFYGGTYWPPTARWGRPGFREILMGVSDAWQNRRDAVEAQADELTSHVVTAASASVAPSPLNENILQNAMQSLLRAADRTHGGFGSAPKFPHAMDLRVALRCWHRTERGGMAEGQGLRGKGQAAARTDSSGKPASQKAPSGEILDVALLTLDKMANGGIYDHLGGGFARYSTDERWLVPHFEKMLYDNALLVPAYLEAYQITGNPDYARVARETLDYVLREMTQPQGGFYSAQDADSEGVEGKFFVWGEAEIDEILGKEMSPDDVALFKFCYDVTARGNWEHSNILNRPVPHAEAAAKRKLDPNQLEAILAECRQKLFAIRSQRVWPARDDKVLAGWNGLMITVMAMGANVLGEPRYSKAARDAADFILKEMVDYSAATPKSPPSAKSSGMTEASSHSRQSSSVGSTTFRLLHSYKDGQARFNGYLDDYAAMIDGLCELYQTVFEAKYLDAALRLAQRMLDQFWDDSDGGFFYTSDDHERLIARTKEIQDNATPSGNSLAATALLKLARLTGRADLEAKAVATLEVMSGLMNRIPLAAGQSLIALDFLLGPTHEVVVSEKAPSSKHEARKPEGQTEVQPVLRLLHERFIPNKVVHFREDALSEEAIPPVIHAPLIGKRMIAGQPTVYLCQHGTCGAPLVGRDAIQTGIDLLAQLATQESVRQH